MKNLRILALLVLVSGCSAEVTSDPPAPVECSFPEGVCPAGNIFEEHVQYDDGEGCWMLTAVCYPEGTPAELKPADCYTATSLKCGVPK